MHSENIFFLSMSGVYMGIKLIKGTVDIINIISLFTSMCSIIIVNYFIFKKKVKQGFYYFLNY